MPRNKSEKAPEMHPAGELVKFALLCEQVNFSDATGVLRAVRGELSSDAYSQLPDGGTWRRIADSIFRRLGRDPSIRDWDEFLLVSWAKCAKEADFNARSGRLGDRMLSRWYALSEEARLGVRRATKTTFWKDFALTIFNRYGLEDAA